MKRITEHRRPSSRTFQHKDENKKHVLTLREFRRQRLDGQNGHSPNSPLTRGKIYTTGCDRGVEDVVPRKAVIGQWAPCLDEGGSLLDQSKH